MVYNNSDPGDPDKPSLQDMKKNPPPDGVGYNAPKSGPRKVPSSRGYGWIDKNGHVNLSFDPGQNIFYSTYKSIAQSFTINDPKTQQSDKQEVGGTLPVIVLGRNSYYYVKSEWYGSGYDDNLFKSYYK
jgi:hypothetical protein